MRPGLRWFHRVFPVGGTHLRSARLALLLLLAGLALVSTGCSDARTGPGGLVISEVMTKNLGSFKAPDGSTPDWIELHNTSGKPVALRGYMLSDDPRKPDKYVFKAGMIQPDGYLLLYATGKKAGSPGAVYLPFRLSSAGEQLTLIAPDLKIADQLTIPALPADVSFGRNGPDASLGSAKVYFGAPTPGTANGRDGKATAEAAIGPKVTTLLINEYCTRNAVLYDEAGDTPDWVELYDSGTKPLDLTGYGLSDDLTKPDKWRFPKVSLASKGYLLLFLSGKTAAKTATTTADVKGPLHVDFRLSAQDTQLVVTDTSGRTVAIAAIVSTPLNVSRGRLPNNPDTWRWFPRPTPGTANTSEPFTKLSGAESAVTSKVLVSEVHGVGAGKKTNRDKDWIELYNTTGKKISLRGYGLSDSSDKPFRMRLAGVSIDPKSTVVITPTTFGIPPQGETIMLTEPTGLVEDTFATGRLRAGGSSGRQVGAGTAGSLQRVFYTKPTKGRVNTGTAYKGYTEVPTIAVGKTGGAVEDGLYITGPVSVTIRAAEPDAKIHYTLNGVAPTGASAVYHGPIGINSSLVIKAIAIRPGYLPSDPVSRTLLKDKPHSLPVVSLSGDPAALIGARGVLMNAASSQEVPVEFAFYEKDGRLGIDSGAAVQLHGQYSRTEKQKSLELKFRSAYGRDDITYPFFPGYSVSTFHRLVLRTSGQDWQFTKVRDAFMTQIIQGQLSVDTMAVRNCVVYVNGKYWGLYDLREKLDQSYVASHYGVNANKVDMVKGDGIVVAGSDRDMKNLIAYVKSHDLRRDKGAYKAVLSRIDEDSLMDWIIAESFFNNTDSGNKKFWRVTTAGGTYHWMVFDLDWGLFPSTYTWDQLNGDLLDPAGHGHAHMFSTALQVSLMKNPAFRDKFIQRYATFINTTFKTDRMLGFLDADVADIRSEMPRQIARWGLPSSLGAWNSNVASLRRITSQKRALVIAMLQRDFGLSRSRMKQLFPKDFR